MGFDSHVLLVLIASPGDTVEERDATERALHAWNASRAEREQVILLPQRWETSTSPRLGARAQSIINEDLVDKTDVVLALFDSRLGTATSEAVSGTAEELQRAHEAGKSVHVWFSDEPLPRDADLAQVEALRAFKASLEPLGLLGIYANPDDLAYQVRNAIESDLGRLGLGPVTTRKEATSATLRARYERDREAYTDGRGRTKYRTRRERIVVQNVGTATADSVRLTISSLSDGDAPGTLDDETPSIIPLADYSWSIFTSMGSARSVRLNLAWTENGVDRSETQDLALA